MEPAAIRTVLIPLDGSDVARGALPTGRAIAARFDATVHTISVPDSDADVAGAVHRCALELEACLVCLSAHGRGRVAGTVLGSTARDIIERVREPVVVVGPSVVDPFAADHLAACVDGSAMSELSLPVAAAWADALGMKLTLVTVAEPSPPPVRIGAPWRRDHGPNEDADEYVRRLADRWSWAAPGLDTFVVYDPIGVGAGMTDYLAAHPTGLVAVTSHLRGRLANLAFGSGAADIVHTSTAPVLVIPAPDEEG